MKQCVDCGKEIGQTSLRCRSCANKASRHKNSEALKKAYAEGKLKPQGCAAQTNSNAFKNWKEANPDKWKEAVERQRMTLLGKRRTTDEQKLALIIYREQCQFNLAGVIDKIEGFDLLKKLGMYDRKRNLNGVVRDHIFSVNDGFKRGVDPKIISHPANCRFITHKSNASKSKRSDITLEELMQKIDEWSRNPMVEMTV